MLRDSVTEGAKGASPVDMTRQNTVSSFVTHARRGGCSTIPQHINARRRTRIVVGIARSRVAQIRPSATQGAKVASPAEQRPNNTAKPLVTRASHGGCSTIPQQDNAVGPMLQYYHQHYHQHYHQTYHQIGFQQYHQYQHSHRRRLAHMASAFPTLRNGHLS